MTLPKRPAGSANREKISAVVTDGDKLFQTDTGFLKGPISYITASDAAWTPDPKTRAIKFTAIGAGGGGGGVDGQGATTNATADSGGGGATCIKFLETIDSSYNITIGAAGAAGAAGNNNGGAGGDTTVVGSVGPGTNCNLSAGGGAGGDGTSGASGNSTRAGSAGGTATGGDLNLAGGSCPPNSTTNGERAGYTNPGASIFPADAYTRNNTTGLAANNPGTGGAGGNQINAGTNRAGGAGGAGLVIIEEFF